MSVIRCFSSRLDKTFCERVVLLTYFIFARLFSPGLPVLNVILLFLSSVLYIKNREYLLNFCIVVFIFPVFNFGKY